jgi:signal transduction histidine kinase
VIRPTLFKTFSFRLALGYVGLFASSAAVIFGFIYFASATFMARQTDEIIETETWSLAEQYNQRGIGGLMLVIASRLRNDLARNNIYILVDRDFHYLAGNLRQWPQQIKPKGYPEWFSIKVATGEENTLIQARVLVVSLPGTVHLLVGREMSELFRARAVLALAMALGLLVTVALGFVWGQVMTGKLLRRLDEVNRASQEIMGGAFSRRIAVSGAGDEFDRLGENLNAMLDRIGELLTAVRQVSDNIAHDLRSPLTRLRARLELALLEPDDPVGHRQAIEEAIAQAETIIATFNALLTIAQAESLAGRKDFEPLDLTALAQDAAELYEPLAEDKSLTLSLDLAPGVQVRGNRHLLSQAVVNLLDNAVKYTPAGGTIQVRVQPGPSGPVLSLSDSGPGIPEAERENVLKRFYRLDLCRNTPGSGLGLSLVAAVARLHGADLVLADNAPGLRVILKFAS